MQKNETPFPNWEWPEFTSDRKRILHNSIKYRNNTLTEAFNDAYNLKLSKKKKEKLELSEYYDVQVGDIINLRIKSVDKKNTIFYSDNFKEAVTCAVNLWQYKRFKDNIPQKAVPCKVVYKDSNEIKVDPISPIYEKWLEKVTGGLRSQWDLSEDKSVTIRDLKLTRGGYFGAVPIEPLSEFLGQDICVKGFIPGSQIVLNIEEDFEKWNGKSVKAFITNYLNDGSDKMSLICSAKEYLKFQGDKNKIEIFKNYTEDNDAWVTETKKVYDGIITGVIHTAKKCGAFVEIPELSITAMVNCKPDELVNHKKQSACKVQWERFDENTYFNYDIGQIQHKDPYIIEDNILKRCNLKAIFKFVE